MNNKFYGVYPALITPFDEKEKVDEKRLRKLVNFLISNRVNGLYICGGTGEGLLMDVSERRLVAEIVKDEVKEEVKIIAQVGTYNTHSAIELSKHAEKIGLDAISSLPPLYYRYSFSEIYDYYAKLSRATSLPLFIYYIPVTTGIFLPNEKLVKLGEIENIIGIKYTHSDFYLLQDLLQRLEGKWIAFSGPDELFLPALTMGVAGCIGSTQNILPDIFVKIYNYFHQGRIKEAMELQSKITRIISLLKASGGQPAWKAALKLRGIDAGYCRAPFRRKLSDEEENTLFKKWKEIFPTD
ncbi:dihydrodipicolinate synthase family protein [Candidatus Aerophobetes bacterium]|nr:dihydrodipicolinate synthase family protein [Candidatus Aerophobetes bacterium]